MTAVRMKAVRIIIFAKAPQPGLAKTRLIPALGAAGAAQLARRMLDTTLANAVAADIGTVELCLTPTPHDQAWQGFVWPPAVQLSGQGEGDLGQRLASAASRGLQQGELIMLIGTDCPALTPALLRAAAVALQTHDAVLHATHDGGYALLGLQHDNPRVFAEIAWSTDSVAASTRARIAELGWRLFEGVRLHDIDTGTDLQWLPAD
ncbi:MAG: TIGR04282 family arsenosugar biosynthesis glycosyltransferase [Pseudomonas sp.]|uniref:TIGR04282 family arsenosugar biosynthesis glycosyltransferase n=1 Tax=Pseudomonas sp. TaxID=306 RepID=UPI0027366A98|nr:TIGR04282 family arsenosugar biosynthesis glycosyltransferase [Pseudomonas sp.]MDP3848042.1 TIGR04282 family arsenosugar biosynthesis glycosyltransferase [Pseudomonas sp.]